MAKDILGKDIQEGQFVIQAAGQGHDKWLQIAVVLEVIDENNVKVQSQSRPGIVRWVNSRLLVMETTAGMTSENVNKLEKFYVDYRSKK